jgi:putative phosphoribosyl transferase
MKAAAARPDRIRALVSRGGRPDLAADVLHQVEAPTLLIVGGLDEPVLTWNRQAGRQISGPTELVVVPGATHLFEEPGTLDEVVRLAIDWYEQHLAKSAQAGAG